MIDGKNAEDSDMTATAKNMVGCIEFIRDMWARYGKEATIYVLNWRGGYHIADMQSNVDGYPHVVSFSMMPLPLDADLIRDIKTLKPDLTELHVPDDMELTWFYDHAAIEGTSLRPLTQKERNVLNR